MPKVCFDRQNGFQFGSLGNRRALWYGAAVGMPKRRRDGRFFVLRIRKSWDDLFLSLWCIYALSVALCLRNFRGNK
jgi:hypothetical protein